MGPFHGITVSRSQIGWWLLALTLAGVVSFAVYSFLGTFVLGVFLYYGTRPAYRRLVEHVPSRGFAAALTLVLVALPALALVGYLAAVGVQELVQTDALGNIEGILQPYVDISSVADDPKTAVERGFDRSNMGSLGAALTAGVGGLDFVATGVVHLFLSFAVVFFLLRDGHRIAAWFRGEAGAGSAAHAYAVAVDRDLTTVYFGNVLTVLAVTILSLFTYNGLNALAPSAVSIPLPTLLALLTGLATFVPLVVGKLVYVPVTLYLAAVAAGTDASLLWFPAVFLVTCFVLLDVLPVMILRPYLSGRSIHAGLMMFAYILGAMLFGWYGLFLGPLVLVLAVQFVRIAFSELVHGEPVSPRVRAAQAMGSDPEIEEAE